MVESPGALVHSTIAESLADFTTGGLDDTKWFVGVASAILANECHRTLIRPAAAVAEYYDAPVSTELKLRNWPVHSITSINIDPTRDFDDSDNDIDSDDYDLFADRGRVYLPYRLPVKKDVIKVTYDYGYSVPKFMQPTEPTGGDSTVDDIWTDGTTIKKYGAGSSWDVYDTEVVPDALMQAVLEYTTFMKKRLKTREVGMTQKERGYAFEGSSVRMEIGIPHHVMLLIADYISYR